MMLPTIKDATDRLRNLNLRRRQGIEVAGGQSRAEGASHLGGSGGMHPGKILKSGNPEMQFPGFSG